MLKNIALVAAATLAALFGGIAVWQGNEIAKWQQAAHPVVKARNDLLAPRELVPDDLRDALNPCHPYDWREVARSYSKECKDGRPTAPVSIRIGFSTGSAPIW